MGLLNDLNTERIPQKAFIDAKVSGQVQIYVFAMDATKIDSQRTRTNDIPICTQNATMWSNKSELDV